MSEKEESTEVETAIETAAAKGGKDKVGDLLRKERLTRRITVETIAKDLKLNVNYIKALEASDFPSLPPEPYVRVYIKSLTKYLSLDTETILREFDRERGVIADTFDKTANKIDVSVQAGEKSHSFLIAAILIVVLGIFAYVAKDKGMFDNADNSDNAGAAALSDTANASANADSVRIADSIKKADDDAIAAMNTPEEAPPTPPAPAKQQPRTIKQAPTPPLAPASQAPTRQPGPTPIKQPPTAVPTPASAPTPAPTPTPTPTPAPAKQP